MRGWPTQKDAKRAQARAAATTRGAPFRGLKPAVRFERDTSPRLCKCEHAKRWHSGEEHCLRCGKTLPGEVQFRGRR
jgi:hypothetical protein